MQSTPSNMVDVQGKRKEKKRREEKRNERMKKIKKKVGMQGTCKETRALLIWR